MWPLTFDLPTPDCSQAAISVQVFSSASCKRLCQILNNLIWFLEHVWILQTSWADDSGVRGRRAPYRAADQPERVESAVM